MTAVIDVPQLAWLFIRGGESIRMTKLSMGGTLLVYGPGPVEHTHHFNDDAVLEDFRRWYHARLIDEGWFLESTSDRRTEQRGPAPARDRRRPRE